MEKPVSETLAREKLDKIIKDCQLKSSDFGIQKLMENFIFFGFPEGEKREDLNIDSTMNNLYYKQDLRVFTFQDNDINYIREVFDQKNGKLLLRTIVKDGVWSEFEIEPHNIWKAEVKVSPREVGTNSWFQLLRNNAVSYDCCNNKMQSAMSQIGILTDFDVSEARLLIEGRDKSKKSTEFEIMFSEQNPAYFPALSIGLMQKDGRVYANTGIELKDDVMVLNPNQSSHEKLKEFILNLRSKGGFKESDNLKTGKYFRTNWVRIG